MRIRERFMPTPARLVTADELERLPKDDYRYELVRGRLTRMSPVAPRHGKIVVTLASLLWQHVRTHDLGEVWTEVGFRLFHEPDTVRAPDVSVVRTDRLPAPESRGFFRGAPDVAFEVLSPDDSPSDVRDKINEFLAAGTPIVVIVDPAVRKVTVHRPGVRPLAIGEGDSLDLAPILPGFRMSPEELFG
jgi:Uma2 family endonuclease